MNHHGKDSNDSQNRFVRLFPDLHPATFRNNTLEALSIAMTTDQDAEIADSNIPAGYTYFGQFIDHDITRDSAGNNIVNPIPSSIFPTQLATPSLDLDCVYGISGEFLNQDGKFTMKLTAETREESRADLERDLTGLARIADSRNEDNLTVMHFHILFQQLHNMFFDSLQPQGLATTARANTAMALTVQHYQYLVLYDFLPKILDGDVYQSVVKRDECVLYLSMPSDVPTMPLEFSGAAYRFGHSMVRESYNWNAHFRPVANIRLLQNTGIGGHLGDITKHNNAWYIDWNEFIPNGTDPFNKAHKINTNLAPSLSKLPHSGGGNLAYRNMARGVSYGLPSGQSVQAAVAEKTKLYESLSAHKMLSHSVPAQKALLRTEGLAKHTPLWYYLLLEAELCREGEHLGPVGSQIVGEVITNIVRSSRHSIIRNAFDPASGPLAHILNGESLTIRHIIDYASDYVPTDCHTP